MERVNLRKQSYSLYAGRENKSYGFERSIFASPFVIGIDGDRNEVLRKFEVYAKNNKELLEALDKVPEDTVWGCWCNLEEDCHVDILIRLREERKNKPIQKVETKTKYKVAVVGSRNYNDKDAIFAFLTSKLGKIDYIISGGCPEGADNIAYEFAKKYGVTIVVHFPNWHPNGVYDRGAGMRRNVKIIKEADVVIAYTTGSRGTGNSIELAKQYNKKLIIYEVEPDKAIEEKINKI